MKMIKESKAQLEVWKWKDIAYREVKNMDLKSAIRKRLEDSIETAKKSRISLKKTN